MIRRLRSACAGVALVGALALPALVAAKPPDLPENGTVTATPDASPSTPSAEAPLKPKEAADVTCPYLRQKMIDRQACQLADPTMGREVIDNLKCLRRADKLLDRAKTLANAGHITEAIDCCARAAKLCPGSPCAKRAADTMFDLALGFAVSTGASEEAAEPESDAPAIDYDVEVGANTDGGLRMCADCALGGKVYHLRYKQGCLSIWKTSDASQKKP